MSDFESITSIGGLLPSDVLSQVVAGGDLEATDPQSYGLVPGERLNDAVTRSWNRLIGLWPSFQERLDALSETERTATSLTRERWLTPLFDELGFAGLPLVGRSTDLGEKEYPISHQWGSSVAIHQLGARLAIDRRTSGIAGAATSSPHGMVQEFLNRSDDHLWALVTNGLVLRILRDNAALTRQAYVEFDLESIFDGELYSDFVVLWLVCHRTRFEGDPPEKCVLERWSQHAVSAGTRALDRLRDGVESAIGSLGEGFLAHPANAELRSRLQSGEVTIAEYQRQLLRVIYRLLFLLVAEGRDLLLGPDADEVRRARYREHYSVRRLVELSRARRGSVHDDLWAGLEVTMRALWRDGAAALGLAPLGSALWSPESVGSLIGARLDNRHLLDAIRSLTLVRDADSRIDRHVDYRNLGAEELGSIYESLLELHAEVDVSSRTFRLSSAAGNERKTTGSYYTPTSLITELLDSALDPVLEEAARSDDPEAAILGLSVLDPACGSGHFLIAAANRIAQCLASIRAGGIEPAPDEVRTALRDVVGRCLYGIDLNPMAVELCKVSLWLEATEPGKPLSFLDHRIVCGNGLIGVTPKLLAEGIPDGAYKALTGDDKAVVSSLKKRNKEERAGQGALFAADGALAGSTAAVAAAMHQIDALGDDTTEALDEKARLLGEVGASAEAIRGRLAADAWCAAFFVEKTADAPPITTAVVRRLLEDPSSVPGEMIECVGELAAEYGFLHPHLAFPDVVAVPDDLAAAENERTGWDGGFDVVLGNPPWEMVQLNEQEFFASRAPEIAEASGAARKRLIRKLPEDDPPLGAAYAAELRSIDSQRLFLGQSGRTPLCGRGRINTYSVFAETMRAHASPTGRAGVIVPSGIATDDTTKFFFQDIVERRNLVSLYDFENRRAIFDGVHRSYKFCLLTLSGDRRPVDAAEFVFFALGVEDLRDDDRRFELMPEDFRLLNPNTRTCPVFPTRRDAELTKGAYRRVPVLIEDGPPKKNPWQITFRQGIFNMTTDSSCFQAREKLDSDGWSLRGNVFAKDNLIHLPLYEGRFGHQYNHRFAEQPGGEVSSMPEEDLSKPDRVVEPQYWVAREELMDRTSPFTPGRALLGFRRVARSNDERTVIATLLPPGPASYGWILTLGPPVAELCHLTAMYNSFAFDYLARSALSQPSFPMSTFEQLPGALGRDALCMDSVPSVLELCYTSWDLEVLARELGRSHPPFRWDPERRALLRAELDGAYFHAYGCSRVDAEHVLDSFPIVKRHDESEHGEYRTKRLVLEAFDRIAEAEATGLPYESILDPVPADLSLCHDPSTRPDWADYYVPNS